MAEAILLANVVEDGFKPSVAHPEPEALGVNDEVTSRPDFAAIN